MGDLIDGRQVTATRLVPYTHRYTHDILPASDSGAYLANGVWMGTTLRR